jgi:hypothetical protein
MIKSKSDVWILGFLEKRHFDVCQMQQKQLCNVVFLQQKSPDAYWHWAYDAF